MFTKPQKNLFLENIIKQFGAFVVVGGIATVIHYAILFLLVELLFVSAVYASAMGYCISGFINYLLNYRFTFASKQSHKKTLPKFAVVSITGLLINTMFMVIFIQNFHLHYVFAQVMTTLLVLIWNFCVNKIWTFSNTDQT